MLRPTRRLAALVAVIPSGTAALVAPVSAGASPELAVTAAPSVPTDEAGHGKVILAFQVGVVPAGTLGALRDLGVEHAIELPIIGAVAVTPDLAVVDLLSTLPGVVTVEPQRRLVSTGTRPGVTGAGVNVAVLHLRDVDVVAARLRRLGVDAASELAGGTGPGEAVPALDSGRHDDTRLRHPLGAWHGRHTGRPELRSRAHVDQEDALTAQTSVGALTASMRCDRGCLSTTTPSSRLTRPARRSRTEQWARC